MNKREQKPAAEVGVRAELGKRLRALREECGLTLRQLATLSGYSQASLSTAETGKRIPRWEVVEAFVQSCKHDPVQWRLLWEIARNEVATHQPQPEPLVVPTDSMATAELGQIGLAFATQISKLVQSWAEFTQRLELARLHDPQRQTTGPLRLPVGFRLDEDGRIVPSDDEVVRQAVADVFALFAKYSCLSKVVEAFAGRPFPLRGSRWGKLTARRALAVLTNPIYAGAYAYGRYRTERKVSVDGTVSVVRRVVPREQWGAIHQEHHEGYISWDQYLEIETQLANPPGPSAPLQ
jgi:transcriptional regulator with XRE-family HTH domain